MWTYTLFLQILNMSLTASIVIVFVLLARLLLKKAPKIFSYALWAVVLFRLLCPVSISSAWSLLNVFDVPFNEAGSIEYIPTDIVHAEYPQVNIPIPGISEVINENLPQGDEQTVADPLGFPMSATTFVWLIGIFALLLHSMVSLIKLRHKLIGAVPLRDNVYLADHIASPFVMGLLRPKIYLPSTLTEQEQTYIIQHERHHIRRFDPIIKILAFAALCVHWFNPFVWLAFVLSGKDMEMSCDEAVMKAMDNDIRAEYSTSLLSLATGRKIFAGTPLAFGEGNTKSRIKNVMNYKRPAFWLTVVAFILCIVMGVCFLTNPTGVKMDDILLEKGYSISNQENFDYTITIPKSLLPNSIYTPGGHTFSENEIVVYQDEITSIYLKKVMVANESDDQLYFIFDYAYLNLPNSGSLLLPYQITDDGKYNAFIGLQSKELTDDTQTYPDALGVRGYGPGKEFVFYVSSDACRESTGTITIKAFCSKLTYEQKSDSDN